MSRIIGLDYGTKRIGLAITDPFQRIATPLTTINTADALPFLRNYIKQEVIDTLVIGMPKRLNNKPSTMTAVVKEFIETLQKTFPGKQIIEQDERYTSSIALNGLVEGGFKKKDRRNKSNLDKVSATIILQSFLARRSIHQKS